MATLRFKGKSAVRNHHLPVPYHKLGIDAKKLLKEVGAEEHLIIKGFRKLNQDFETIINRLVAFGKIKKVRET